MKHIASEDQAERIGEDRTGGKRGKEFRVFRYEQKATRLTLFGIEIVASGETITLA